MGDLRQVKISVRNLVEFILNSGDLDNRVTRREPDAMQEGSRIHRKIQKQMGDEYRAEVALSITVPAGMDGDLFEICVEGRADGVIREERGILIDEIKGIYYDLDRLEEPFMIHKAQAMCYAHIYATQYKLEQIGVQMTYCNIETELIKRFEEWFSKDQLEGWFSKLIQEYEKWASWKHSWMFERNQSIKAAEFPFGYRTGQKELVAGVYRSIIRDKRLFIEAPTGVGKTISTVFPAVKAMGEGLVEKIFYLTAKTITRTVAEDTFHILMEQGLKFKLVTITAKDKVCILESSDCNPVACERAKGHFDRVNDAVFDLLLHETKITRELIEEYAKNHMVCPYEMSLDVTLWADGLICDYNYAFDPNVYLRRFFAYDKKQDFVFLIDEAHNLVDRAREMYSAALMKEDILKLKRSLLEDRKAGLLVKRLEACNKELLALKRECDECEVWEDISSFVMQAMKLMTAYEEYLQDGVRVTNKDEILRFYLEMRHFLNIHDLMDDNYLIYTDFTETGEFRLKLLCMDPSVHLKRCLDKGKSAVFFSATLLPIQYYKEQLGGREDDYAVYAPSPFDTAKRLLMIGRDVSTKYSRRSSSEYERILRHIEQVVSIKKGNYMVFFPSYQMMYTVAELAGYREADEEGEFLENMRLPGLVLQKNNMTEQDREAFLEAFIDNPKVSRVGFCVMGGIFSEGIDLKNDRLIGAVIVGTGLPMVCNERELFRGYYDRRNGCGFDYAYLYAGMNKVLQSAGRVIRTTEDKGLILLLDERFRQMQYQNLFPREWYPYEVVTAASLKSYVEGFWKNVGE